MAVEKEIEKTGVLKLSSILFDESGYFLLVPTMLGVKIINVFTNRLTKIIGKPENLRILRLALFQVRIDAYRGNSKHECSMNQISNSCAGLREQE